MYLGLYFAVRHIYKFALSKYPSLNGTGSQQPCSGTVCIYRSGARPNDQSSPPRGRGTASNPHNRFAPNRSVAEDDGWYQEVPLTQGTEVMIETAKTIITRNTSPDLPFDRSINPYRGCEHGCIYCYARPSHAYWDMSPGLDFETRLIAKTNAAQVLEEQLGKKGYHVHRSIWVPIPTRISRSNANTESPARPSKCCCAISTR